MLRLCHMRNLQKMGARHHQACIDPTAKSGDFFGPKEWSGFAEKLTPEKDLLTDANKSVLLDGTKLAGLPEL